MNAPDPGTHGAPGAAGEPPGPDLSLLAPPAPGRARLTAGESAKRGGEALSAESYYASALRRAQLRLSVSVAAGFLAVVSVLAVAVSTWDLLESIRPYGLPLSWWLIGVAMYPLVVGAALLYQAAARRLERRYQRVSGA